MTFSVCVECSSDIVFTSVSLVDCATRPVALGVLIFDGLEIVIDSLLVLERGALPDRTGVFCFMDMGVGARARARLALSEMKS